MIILLVPYDVNHLIDRIIVETKFGRADVLRHIHRCAVGAQQDFLVQPFRPQVCPYRPVVAAIKQSFLQSFQHFLAPFEIRLRFIINLIEIDSEPLIRPIKAIVHPTVHPVPQLAHLGIAGFPASEHLTRLGHQRRPGFGLFLTQTRCHELTDFLTVMLVEHDIKITDQMIAFLPRRFGRHALAPFLPGQHRLADVDSPIVDDIRFNHPVTVGFQNFRQTVSQQIVTHMSEMERLIRVGRRVFDHHQRSLFGRMRNAVGLLRVHRVQHLDPVRSGDCQVQKAFNHIE